MQVLARPSRVTAFEVATACGVSQPTVSRILANGDAAGRYSSDTRKKVIEAAERLGYRPNMAARSTRTGRFGVVSLLLTTANGRSSLPTGLLRGIQDVLMGHGVRLHVSMLPDEDLIQTWGVPDALSQAHSDGLLINYTHQIPGQLVELIRGHHLPSVWLNSKQATDCVYPDDFDAGYRMTQRLLSRGHRRIAYMDFSHHWPLQAEHYSAIDRHAGYAAAMAEAGLEQILIVKPAPEGSTSGTSPFVHAITRPDRPTAVVSYSAVRAIDMYVPLTRMGLSVPDDVEFAAVHTLTEPLGSMPLHVLPTPDAALGAEAARLLLERIANPRTPLPPRVVPFEWHAGETCSVFSDRS